MKHKSFISTISRKKLLKQVYTPDSTAIINDDDVTGSENDLDDRFFDKWGPAGCIEVESDNKQLRKFVFFGIAST